MTAPKAKKAEGRKKAPPEDIFWADQIAGQIIERSKQEGRTAVCKAATSPSGAKHIGNMFDFLKAYFPCKAVRSKGVDCKFVITHDDRDPLRTIPAQLPDKAGKMQPTDSFKEEWSQYLGVPYTRVPDPFNCCRTWAQHFSTVLESGLYAMGIRENEVDILSADVLYSEGKFDPFIQMALRDIQKTRRVFAPFQETMPADYIPLVALCEDCGKITAKVTSFDIASRTMKYACVGKELAGKYKIEGCDHTGEASWHEGKLAWRFEWPATWGIFNVTYEPFGKEHAEGSWPSGQAIAKDIYGFEPPIPHIYEFILVDGKKMAARLGNVYIVQQILEILEPEVLAFFYTKRSGKQRNFDVKNVYLLVNDFEKAERVYFGAEEETNAENRATLVRQYESAMPEVPERLPKRVEYQFAAVVGQLAPDLQTAIKMLRQSGHIKPGEDVSRDDEFYITRRLNLARNWARSFAKENTININDEVPGDIREKLDEKQRAAIALLSDLLSSDVNQPDLYNAFFEIAKEAGLEAKEFFRAVYLALLSQPSGPRLAPFILALGRDRVRKLLEQV